MTPKEKGELLGVGRRMLGVSFADGRSFVFEIFASFSVFGGQINL
jgi:hypothetical protein